MNSVPSCQRNSVPAPVRLFLASSNPGKLEEYRGLAESAVLSSPLDLQLVAKFEALPTFEENAPTFAENATGKAAHYSNFNPALIFADDSGLVVPSLDGAPGVHSARYAGPEATPAARIEKLLNAMQSKKEEQRAAHFVCAIALARAGRTLALVTGRVDGFILEAPRGSLGFGYDPVFYFSALQKTFAQMTPEEKNKHSHRGKAFRTLLDVVFSML